MRLAPLPLLLLLLLLALVVAWLLLGMDSEPTQNDMDGTSPTDTSRTSSTGLRGAGPNARPESTTSGAAAAAEPLPPWPIGEPDADAPGEGLVYVRLVDGKGKPLPHHPIVVDWWKRFGVLGANTGRTNAEGLFRTTADAVWELDSVSVPLRGGTENNLYCAGPFAAAPAKPHEVIVEVPSAGRIEGRALDRTGRPLETGVGCTASPTLSTNPFLFRMHIRDRLGETDAEGYFAFPVVTGRYTVILRNAKLPVMTAAVVTLTVRHPRAELKLHTAAPLEGRQIEVFIKGVQDRKRRRFGVTARTLAPVFGLPDATQTVRHEPALQLRRSRRIKPGHYVIDHVFGDPWTLYIYNRSSGMTELPIPTGATRMEVTLTPKPRATPPSLRRTIRVVGRLPDGTTVRPSVTRMIGPTVAGSRFSGMPDDGQEGEPIPLRGGEATYVALSYRGMAYVGLGPLDAATAPAHIEVPFEKAGDARVELVDKRGKPVPAEFELFPTTAFFRSVTAGGGTEPGTGTGDITTLLQAHRIVTGDDGLATFRSLGSVRYRVVATPEDKDLRPARGAVRAGETLSLVLGDGIERRTTLTGLIVDAQTGAPVEGARVEATTADGASEEGYAEGLSSADGSFRCHGLPQARTRVFVRQRGYAFPRLDPVDLARDLESLTIRLVAARRLPLRVLDARGRPVKTAVVQARRPDGTLIQLQDQYGNRDGEAFETDADGRVDLLGVPAGHVTVEVEVSADTENETFEVDARKPFERLVTVRLSR